MIGRDSSVGIATGYGLDGPGNESGGGEIFRTSPDRPWGSPILLYNGYRVFTGGKLINVYRTVGTYRTVHMNQFQLNNESGW